MLIGVPNKRNNENSFVEGTPTWPPKHQVKTGNILNLISLHLTCSLVVPTILGFYTIPRDTKNNRHSGHVGVPNKRNNQNSCVKSTPTWPP